MRRTGIVLALAVGSYLTAGVALTLAGSAACGEPVAAPTYKVGETWT